MQEVVTQFAAATTAAENESILQGLGIDFTLLILQAIAFLLTVLILAKWVYPVFMRIIDEREAKINESVKAAEAAEAKAGEAESKIEDTLKTARVEAADIVATAKAEATQMVEKAEADAKKRSDHIVAEAHEALEKDVLAARKALEKDTIELVKRAASLATASIADDKLDGALIKKSVDGAKR